MNPYAMIKAHLSAAVPFAAHVGVELDAIGPGTASATLGQSHATSNHIATMHAGALFTLAEAASGAAIAGMFVERLAALRPVAASAAIDYMKPAKGLITAHARIDDSKDALFATLDAQGKVRFAVSVAMVDGEGRDVAKMRVDWHVAALAKAA